MKAAIIVSLALAFASTAHADPAERAKSKYQQGRAHYDRGDYAKAIEAWHEAYRLSEKPMLLFNLGQAYRLLGDCATAMKICGRSPWRHGASGCRSASGSRSPPVTCCA